MKSNTISRLGTVYKTTFPVPVMVSLSNKIFQKLIKIFSFTVFVMVIRTLKMLFSCNLHICKNPSTLYLRQTH